MSVRPFLGSHVRRAAPTSVGAARFGAIWLVAIWFGATWFGTFGCESEWVTLGRMQSPVGTTASTNPNGTGGASIASGGTDTRDPGPAGGANTVGGASTTGGTTASTLTGGTAAGGFSEPRFTDVTRVPSLASDYADDNPTLTDNLLELYFSSKSRPGGKGNVDVWVAKRATLAADFDAPTLVSAVSTEGVESSPAVSGNGLTLWVGSEAAADGLGGYDILQSTRASNQDEFGAPVLVRELSSAKDDIPRPLGAGGLIMPLASRRDSTIYWTYLARRPSTSEPFEAPILVQELIIEGQNVADAFLTSDGLTLFFAHSLNEVSDLFVAHRIRFDAPFDQIMPLSTINSPNDDRDPWLSPDGKLLYFSSDRHQPGTLNIYQARLVE